MKKKIVKYLLLVMITFLIIASTVGCQIDWTLQNQNEEPKQKHNIAVIVKSTTSAFWKSVKSGAGAASAEYNVNILFEGPDNEEDYQRQNQMIEKAVANGAEAIVFSAVDYEANAKSINQAIKEGVKVVVIDSDVHSDGVSLRIGTDNFLAGKKAGQALMTRVSGPCKVGIVNFDANSENGQQREKGFLDTISKHSEVEIVETLHVRSTTQFAKEETEDMIARHPDLDQIVTFNEWTSLGVGYAIQELGLKNQINVVAFDSNAVSVGMLETGEVDTLIVQNPYAMGYLGVEYANKLINNENMTRDSIDTATTVITKETMYSMKSQRALFSFE